MFHYFLKKRLKKHDEQNNIKLKGILTAIQLQQLALNSSLTGVGNSVDQEIVISLTSFDKRVDNLYLCIESLFQQSLKADKIVLWLSEKNFPNKSLPKSLLMQVDRGLEIRFVKEDVGPYKKLIYSLQEYPNSLICTVDDDIIYPQDMLDKLYRSYLLEPDKIHCHRARSIAFSRRGVLKPYNKWPTIRGDAASGKEVFPTGVAGVLYFPGSLHPDVANVELFMKLAPGADDVWLKAMSLLQGTECRNVCDYRDWKTRFLPIEHSQAHSLKQQNWKSKNGNDEKLESVFKHYNLERFFI